MNSGLAPGNPEQQHLKVGDRVENPYQEPAQQPPMPQPGDKIGPNKVQLLIGEGGSANVYKVWHEGLEVVRAVKILKKSQNKESRERFLTEAKILADIHHPNIVEIHNIGYLDAHVPFLEMEYVEGISIKKLIDQRQHLPLAAALGVAYFVSQALQYSHVKDYTLYGKIYRGLIHRDIKPDNIVVSRDGLVKLMDFGIARPSEVSLHTVGAKIMGTLVYLSPEQLNGRTLDHRSDIFSLGTVLYEMVTGNRAFPQKTLSELVQKKTKGIYRPIDSYEIAVPKSLNAVIEKSMALEPDERYASAADFGHEVYAVLREISDRAPQDILSRYMKDPESVPPWQQSESRSKVAWIAGSAVAAAGIIATILMLSC